MRDDSRCVVVGQLRHLQQAVFLPDQHLQPCSKVDKAGQDRKQGHQNKMAPRVSRVPFEQSEDCGVANIFGAWGRGCYHDRLRLSLCLKLIQFFSSVVTARS